MISWLPHEIITRHTRPRTRGRRTAPLILLRRLRLLRLEALGSISSGYTHDFFFQFVSILFITSCFLVNQYSYKSNHDHV